MITPMIRQAGEAFPHDPSARGYHVVYRMDEVNHCPGCGRSNWYVGRLLAECGFCSTALPLADAGMVGVGTMRHHRAQPADLASAA